VRRVTPAARARITVLLWCVLIAGGAVVLAGALGEGSGSAPPVATREAGELPPRPKSWDFSADFARSRSAARNPSADRYGTGGVWRYMAARSERSRDPSGFALLRRYRESLQGLAGFDAWVGADDPSVSVSFPIIGVRGGARSARGFAHPSVARRAIVAWRSPVRGRVVVRGALSDLDATGGDGVSWALRRGSTTLARGRLANAGRAQRFGLAVAVDTGDICSLMIAPGENSAYDSTGISLRIEEQRPEPAATRN
jgi:hypothetical protein